MVALNYDQSQYEPDAGTGPVPKGDYPVVINDIQENPTNANLEGKNDNMKLDYELEVSRGEYAGRRIWMTLNHINDSAKAEEIARKQQAAINLACTGNKIVNDTDKLLGREMQVYVVVEERDGYAPKNVVKGIKAVSKKTVEPSSVKTKSQPPQDVAWDDAPAKPDKETKEVAEVVDDEPPF